MGPPYNNTTNLKSQRFKDEQKLKILKWQFTQPRGEFVDQLKEQMTNANFNRTLFTQMYHADFKQHLKAIGKNHAFKRYDQFALNALNTSCFWGSTNISPVVQFHEIFATKL